MPIFKTFEICGKVELILEDFTEQNKPLYPFKVWWVPSLHFMTTSVSSCLHGITETDFILLNWLYHMLQDYVSGYGSCLGE